MKKISLLLIFTFILSCKKETVNSANIQQNKDSITTKKELGEIQNSSSIKKSDLDINSLKLLQELDDICVEDDGVFKNCDELYTKEGSNLFFLIIPKIGANNWHNATSKNLKGEIYEINEQLSRLVLNKKSKTSFGTEFDVWAFYIDKKYTKKINLDTPYTTISPRQTYLLKLISSSQEQWEVIETFNVKSDKDETTETDWRNNKIDEFIAKSNLKENNKTLPSDWIGQYSGYFDYGNTGGQNSGWELNINISNSNIIAKGDGFQIGFEDELSLIETSDNEIQLKHKKNISGYKQGQKMNPEFTLKKVGQKFYINSKWITSDVKNKKNKEGYLIEKN